MLAAIALPASGTDPLAISAELRGVQPRALQHHHELIGVVPAFRILLGAGITIPCNRRAFLQLKRVTT